MNLDDFKEPWQQQQRELDRCVDHVIKAVRSRMSSFDRVIWFRDLRETVAAFVVFVWFGYDFFRHEEWLAKFGAMVVVLASVMIMVILNWVRLTGRVARPGQSLQAYCTAELARVDRQIWLLRNINWWYTGPLYVGVTIEIFGLMSPPQALIFLLTMLIPIGWFIYWLNQRAVRSELMPLRHELAGAMDVNDNDPVVQEGALFSAAEPVKLDRRTVVLTVSGWLALVGFGCYLEVRLGVDDDAPKVSPFTEVRFEGDQVIVTYDGQTYQWLAIDEIEVEDIVSSAKWRFGFLWQKRVAEDMIDLLWGMQHQPGSTVKLRLFDLATKQEVVVKDAPLSKENRQAIYWNRDQADDEAADAKDDDESASNLPIDETLRARLVGRYQLAPDFIFDVQDRDGHLMVGITNQSTQEVFPDSATRWSYRSVDATLEFKLGRSGPAKRLVLHQNGIRQTAWRMGK